MTLDEFARAWRRALLLRRLAVEKPLARLRRTHRVRRWM